MAICVILTAGMAALLILSARVKLPRGFCPPKGTKAFYRAAYLLLWKLSEVKKSRLKPFDVERLSHVLLVAFLGVCVSLLAQGASKTAFLIDGYGLSRPKGGENVRQLQAEIGEEQLEQMEVVVQSREHTEEEKQELLAKAVEELEALLPLEEDGAGGVRGRVELPDTLMEGRVRAAWTQEPAGILDEEGFPSEELPDEGTLLQLKAVLTCEDRECIYECALNLLPPLYTKEEELMRALAREVEEADESSAKEDIFLLPREVDGQKIVWKEQENSVIFVCLFLTVLAAVCAWIGKGQEQKKQNEQRARQMTLDYPDLLFKLSMLLNAGLTMQNAFFKIAMEYRVRKKQGIRYAYEEMLTACYEMKSGVPEARAYENFGRRCQGGYAKLGAMLSSNLQKGSEGLADILQQEAQLAMEERRQMARKLGEEAGTKLLLPMVLMLLVVLVILLAPAMFAF